MTHKERRRLAQAKYRRTAKGKATERRYNRGAAHRAAVARYAATERGATVKARDNARRIFVNRAYCGRADTPDHAAVIRQHVKERTREFISRQQGRAHLEISAADAVQA